MIELLLQADRLLTVDLVDAADAIYRKVAEADPHNGIAVVGMARCALARGDDHEAYRLAARALTIDPQNDMARRMEARLDEVLRTRGEVPGQGAAAAKGVAAAAAPVVAQGQASTPVKHRWPAVPPSRSQPAADAVVGGGSGAPEPGIAEPGVAPRAADAREAPASAVLPDAASAPVQAHPSSWAARIHHVDPPPSGAQPTDGAPAGAAGTGTEVGSGSRGPSARAPSSASAPPSGPKVPAAKRSLLDRLRGR